MPLTCYDQLYRPATLEIFFLGRYKTLSKIIQYYCLPSYAKLLKFNVVTSEFSNVRRIDKYDFSNTQYYIIIDSKFQFLREPELTEALIEAILICTTRDNEEPHLQDTLIEAPDPLLDVPPATPGQIKIRNDIPEFLKCL